MKCVPGKFESVEEYVRVFEPLLFEECRAQLYSTWEESTETVSRDTHIMVRVKANESRERGTVFNINLNSPYVCRKFHSPNFKEFNFLLLCLYFLGTQPYFEDVFLAFSLQGSTNMIPQFGDISVNYPFVFC